MNDKLYYFGDQKRFVGTKKGCSIRLLTSDGSSVKLILEKGLLWRIRQIRPDNTPGWVLPFTVLADTEEDAWDKISASIAKDFGFRRVLYDLNLFICDKKFSPRLKEILADDTDLIPKLGDHRYYMDLHGLLQEWVKVGDGDGLTQKQKQLLLSELNMIECSRNRSMVKRAMNDR